MKKLKHVFKNIKVKFLDLLFKWKFGYRMLVNVDYFFTAPINFIFVVKHLHLTNDKHQIIVEHKSGWKALCSIYNTPFDLQYEILDDTI